MILQGTYSNNNTYTNKLIKHFLYYTFFILCIVRVWTQTMSGIYNIYFFVSCRYYTPVCVHCFGHPQIKCKFFGTTVINLYTYTRIP